MGDFNRHNLLWEEEHNSQLFTTEALQMAKLLLDLIATYGMKMALPKGIPTLQHLVTKNWTRPDNIFASEELIDAFIQCNVVPDRCPPNADHVPIISNIEIPPERIRRKLRKKWKETDWDKFRARLEQNLS